MGEAVERPDCFLGDSQGPHGHQSRVSALKVVIGVSVPAPVVRVDRPMPLPRPVCYLAGDGEWVVVKVCEIRYLGGPGQAVLSDGGVEPVAVAVLPGVLPAPPVHYCKPSAKMGHIGRVENPRV